MAASVTRAQIVTWADQILRAIHADMRDGFGPARARIPYCVYSFAALHDYCDANEYTIDARVPVGPDPGSGEDGTGTVNAVCDEVARQLAIEAERIHAIRPCGVAGH